MPIFEYICDECTKEFHFHVRAGVPPVCPRCWNQKVTKQLSLFTAKTSSSSATNSESDTVPEIKETPHVHTSTCGHSHKSPESSCNSDAAAKLIEKHLGK